MSVINSVNGGYVSMLPEALARESWQDWVVLLDGLNEKTNLHENPVESNFSFSPSSNRCWVLRRGRHTESTRISQTPVWPLHLCSSLWFRVRVQVTGARINKRQLSPKLIATFCKYQTFNSNLCAVIWTWRDALISSV